MSEPLTLYHWTRAEYDRLVELGAFDDHPIELIGGQLVVAEPKGSYHSCAVSVVDYALRAVLPPGWTVRTQAPVALDDDSEPEPDVAVVPGEPRDYRHAHPARPVLAIEVADSSLRFDRRHKSSLYARAGLADYWILNLVERRLEVYRDPVEDAQAPYGWRYRRVTTLGTRDSVTPLAFAFRLRVADLLP